MATASFSDDETLRAALWNTWKAVLGGNGPVTRAKARAVVAVNQTVHAVNNSSLTQ